MPLSRLFKRSVLSACVALAGCGGSSTQPPPPVSVSVSVTPSNATVGAARRLGPSSVPATPLPTTPPWPEAPTL